MSVVLSRHPTMAHNGRSGIQLPGIREVFPDFPPSVSMRDSPYTSDRRPTGHSHQPPTPPGQPSPLAHRRAQSAAEPLSHPTRNGAQNVPMAGVHQPAVAQGHQSPRSRQNEMTGSQSTGLSLTQHVQSEDPAAPPRAQDKKKYMCQTHAVSETARGSAALTESYYERESSKRGGYWYEDGAAS
ncbi:hypothetical protein NM688_g4055 [Phlebia brevispora]|uniref:Uncharacterized protein n=1 Tax=Phlebia brevispora TaxID=194682 RepID=A0ACC1T3Y9_9APHY|nr:hypothetical protein NM688_g4055 [Phlebia brevispora]